MADNPAHLDLLEAWLKSYRPEELFDDSGFLKEELRPWRHRGNAGWVRIRTPMAGSCSGT